MSAIAGKKGKVMIGANTVADLGKWNLDASADMIESTALGADWKGNIPGLLGASGKAEGNWNMSDTNGQLAIQNAFFAGTALALKLYVNATNYYSGSAYISKLPVSVEVAGKVTVSFEFTFDGAVTYA